MARTAMKITSKGQVTIPKKIRDLLKSDVVTFAVVDHTVVIRPVPDAGGSLREYAGNVRAGSSFAAMKDRAWEDVVREKARKESP